MSWNVNERFAPSKSLKKETKKSGGLPLYFVNYDYIHTNLAYKVRLPKKAHQPLDYKVKIVKT